MTRSISCKFLLTALLLALSLFSHSAHAAGGYDSCKGFIKAVPSVISTRGTWCVSRDLTTSRTSGNVITIAADNVTIDCNGFKIGGMAAGPGTAMVGIRAVNRRNITVRNCTIRGFLDGVYLSGTAGGHKIEDNRFDGNTYIGMQVEGDQTLIRRNQVSDTGGSTIQNSAYGIVANNSVDILDNTITGVAAQTGGNGSAYGVYTRYNVAGTVGDNRVNNVLKDGTGFEYGIYNEASGNVVLNRNHLLGDRSASSQGFFCADAKASARDNVINGFATGFTGCDDDGGNVVAQ